MKEFIQENPGAALALGSILASGVVILAGITISLVKERAKTAETHLERAIKELRDALASGLSSINQTLRLNDVRVSQLEAAFYKLHGEHQNRDEHCPGATALNRILADGGFHLHRRNNDEDK